MSHDRITRRDVARAAGALATVSAAATVLPAPAIAQGRPPHALQPLPYSDTGLDPVISARTISFHYGAHHKAYVDNLNRFAETDAFAAQPLEEIIKASAVNPNRAAFFNNAAMIWNHTFYWNSLRPNGGGEPGGALKAQIEKDLGGMDKFKADFATAANGLFGSGWAWLVWHTRDKKLGLVRTNNGDTPIVRGDMPLLTIDVWEHAYYLDYQNRRAAYTAALIDKLLNWEWAAQQFDKAVKSG
ncbi:MAG: superoxide dismutase [Alphaproteobacteria bacterium]|nr:superoxide dismutase [Alphaproteobacteria bacterium]